MRYRKVENLLRFRNPRRQDSKLFYRVAVLLLILLLLISPLSGMLVNADEAESESETSATENETETTPETEAAGETETEVESASTATEGHLISPAAVGDTINRYGRINSNYTRYRSQPNFGENILGILNMGTRIEVLREVAGEIYAGSVSWYEIKIINSNTIGYVHISLIDLEEAISPVVPIDPDEDFEAYLDQQGFPESYRPALRTLHAKYPSWIFTASHPINANGTPMKWSTVMSYETDLSRANSVPASYPVAQRSFDKGAYNYKTNTWKAADAGFVYASPEIIAYYLDPRNFLNEQQIFQFENLGYNPQVQTRADVANSLHGSFMADNKTVSIIDRQGTAREMLYPDIFLEAAEWSKASPIFLAKRSLQEVGRNGSDAVSGTVSGYEGIFNYYNIGSYAGTSPIRNGLQYAKYGSAREPNKLTANEKNLYLLPWTNPYLSIVGGARWISEGYINAGQKTAYYQKWNIDYAHKYGPWWHQYMGNVIAPTSEGSAVYSTYKDQDMLNEKHEFIIPVLAEMPAKASPLPTDNRSRNNWLKSISVSSGVLKPAFDPEVSNYTVSVAQGVSNFVVNASTYHSAAKIQGNGTYGLNLGENTIQVQAISERGDVRNYYIKVTRADDGTGSGGDERPEAILTSSTLDVGSAYVSNAAPEQNKNTVEYLSSNLNVPAGYKLVISDSSGKVVTSGLVGTGAKLSLHYQNETKSMRDYYLLIYGDASGDGRINSHDSMAAYRYILGLTQPSAIEKLAMDVTRDGTVNSHDTMGIYRHILGLKLVDQAK
ncbi:MAG TPA: hypothetical protein GXZ81_00695 [Fastidiosipila sp.]|nr:hypothetical protein [Fastidiosipila sp.]